MVVLTVLQHERLEQQCEQAVREVVQGVRGGRGEGVGGEGGEARGVGGRRAVPQPRHALLQRRHYGYVRGRHLRVAALCGDEYS